MTDIKKRTEVINLYLHKGLTTGYVATDVDAVALQFRKIFEHIALSSLVAHKEQYAKQRKSFATDWKADKIINTIEKINPHFYPIPTKQVIGNNGKVEKTITITEGFLTKNDLIEGVNICGNILHADNPFSPYKDFIFVKKQFPIWQTKIRTLLNHHQVQLYDSKYQIWCVMHGASEDKNLNGRVNVTLMKLVGQA
ncbi:MAG: hypothetical protein JNK73_04040 [Bacteroidia bacterium]|nr:hypothetical protein [Bacteroidia bacterium]